MNYDKKLLILASIQSLDKNSNKLWNKKHLCKLSREEFASPFNEYFDIELKHTQKELYN